MTNLTPEERAIRKQSIENISEIYVPISVIEEIKEHLYEAMAILTMENPPQEVIDAYKELNAIDHHIKEYTK